MAGRRRADGRRDHSGRDVNPLIILPGFFAAGSLYHLGRAALDTLRVHKYGMSVLEANEVYVGATLHGVIRTDKERPLSGCVVRLQCIETLRDSGTPNSRGGYRQQTRRERHLPPQGPASAMTRLAGAGSFVSGCGPQATRLRPAVGQPV